MYVWWLDPTKEEGDPSRWLLSTSIVTADTPTADGTTWVFDELTDLHGVSALLGDQDRSRWDVGQIADGRAELDRALAIGGRGPYVLQAAIASLHAQSPCDWAQIAALYDELARLTASPVVELNRAIAVAETQGAEAALRLIDGLGLDDFRYFYSTKAELLRRLGRIEEARAAYRRARELTDDGPERRFLDRRLTELPVAGGEAATDTG